MIKRAISILLSVVLLTVLIACSSNSLYGTYVSDSGTYTVIFKKDGTCRWFESETVLDGTYEKGRNSYTLYIRSAMAWGSDTTFVAIPVDGGLQITGGVVNGEIFRKK